MSNIEKPTALRNDLEETTASFEGFLTPQEPIEETAEDEVQEVEEITEEEVLEPEADDEIDEESEEEEETEEEVEEQDLAEDLNQPQTFSVKVDGVEYEVTEEELMAGYSRQQDYTRKTQKLAEQAKSVEQKDKELAEKDAIYAQLLPKLEAQIQGQLGNEPDWDALYEQDPVAYVKKQQEWNAAKEQLKKVEEEQARVQEEQQAEQVKQIQELVELGNQRLLEEIPEWSKPEVAQKEKLEIRQFAIEKLGFTAQEIDATIDYRALLGLRKAMLYDKTVEATKKKPTQKAASRVAKPGAVTKTKKVAPAKKAKQRLAKSGKVQDAAKVFEQMLNK
tara:strand:- start:106 stop:1110 length:1005 start_codon:yes stop_codon:yes gene_type:complete